MNLEASSPEDLVREIHELRAQVREQEDQLLRARAELENQRKRGARANEEARKFALQEFVRELLPVRDSLERGVEAIPEDAGEENGALGQGIRLTLRLWDDVLASSGVEEVDPIGQPFDPELHEALSMRSSADLVPNTVVEVAQKGYLLHGRLIRPARVVIATEGASHSPFAE